MDEIEQRNIAKIAEMRNQAGLSLGLHLEVLLREKDVMQETADSCDLVAFDSEQHRLPGDAMVSYSGTVVGMDEDSVDLLFGYNLRTRGSTSHGSRLRVFGSAINGNNYRVSQGLADLNHIPASR